MNFNKIKEGNDYIVINIYNGIEQIVNVLKKTNSNIKIVYVSNDVTKGLITYMNEIECERYLFEMTKFDREKYLN